MNKLGTEEMTIKKAIERSNKLGLAESRVCAHSKGFRHPIFNDAGKGIAPMVLREKPLRRGDGADLFSSPFAMDHDAMQLVGVLSNYCTTLNTEEMKSTTENITVLSKARANTVRFERRTATCAKGSRNLNRASELRQRTEMDRAQWPGSHGHRLAQIGNARQCSEAS